MFFLFKFNSDSDQTRTPMHIAHIQWTFNDFLYSQCTRLLKSIMEKIEEIQRTNRLTQSRKLKNSFWSGIVCTNVDDVHRFPNERFQQKSSLCVVLLLFQRCNHWLQSESIFIMVVAVWCSFSSLNAALDRHFHSFWFARIFLAWFSGNVLRFSKWVNGSASEECIETRKWKTKKKIIEQTKKKAKSKSARALALIVQVSAFNGIVSSNGSVDTFY